MAAIKATFDYPLNQCDAEKHTINGFCGDITHPGDVSIISCTALKMMVISLDASYSVVHAKQAIPSQPTASTKATPIVLPATEMSKAVLAEVTAVRKDQQAKAQDGVVENKDTLNVMGLSDREPSKVGAQCRRYFGCHS